MVNDGDFIAVLWLLWWFMAMFVVHLELLTQVDVWIFVVGLLDDACDVLITLMHLLYLFGTQTVKDIQVHYACEWFKLVKSRPSTSDILILISMGSRAGCLSAGLSKNHSPAIAYTKHCQMLLSIRSSATNENQHLSAVKKIYIYMNLYGNP